MTGERANPTTLHLMSNPEIHTFDFRGAPIRAHLTHSDVRTILSDHGRELPPIPAGCNTVSTELTLRTGERALICVQGGFAPEARDDEREVNGAVLLVLADPAWSAADADRILSAVQTNLLGGEP